MSVSETLQTSDPWLCLDLNISLTVSPASADLPNMQHSPLTADSLSLCISQWSVSLSTTSPSTPLLVFPTNKHLHCKLVRGLWQYRGVMALWVELKSHSTHFADRHPHQGVWWCDRADTRETGPLWTHPAVAHPPMQVNTVRYVSMFPFLHCLCWLCLNINYAFKLAPLKMVDFMHLLNTAPNAVPFGPKGSHH